MAKRPAGKGETQVTCLIIQTRPNAGSSDCCRAVEIFSLEQIGTIGTGFSYVCSSDGGARSAGQTENSFRQSQTILRDLKHPSLQKKLFLGEPGPASIVEISGDRLHLVMETS